MNPFKLFSDSKPLGYDNAPGFCGSVERLAEKAGIKGPVKIRNLKMSAPNAMYHPISNTLFVTDGILDLMGSKNLHAPASKEMEAVMAHELGHMKFAVRQFAPMILVTAALPLVANTAAYMVERTYEQMKKDKETNPAEPQRFWDEFGKVCDQAKQKPWQTAKDLLAYMYPIPAKLIGAERYKDKTWARTMVDQGRIMAIHLVSQIPSYAACRPFALRNEWEADKFMIALTQDKEACLSAFQKLSDYSGKAVAARAKTPLQKGIAEKLINSYGDFLQNTIMAHPELAHRLDHIRQSNPQALAQKFGISF